MDETDCLSLEFVEAAFDFGGVPYERGRSVPIRGRRIEDPRKIVAVGRGGGFPLEGRSRGKSALAEFISDPCGFRRRPHQAEV
jgi:hypothetical protein